jgi:hypothetical protein
VLAITRRRRGRALWPASPLRRQARQAAQVKAIGRMHSKASRSTAIAPTRARRRRRVGDRLGSRPYWWRNSLVAQFPQRPGLRRYAARISGSIDAGEPCVGAVVEDEDRVARRLLGRTCSGAPLEDQESSTRCSQSLEEAQAAMLSSGSLHFGSPRVQPGFPIRPSARSSEVSPFLPASAVVRLPHT